MTYLIRYAIAESNFMKALILRHFVAYGIPNLNSLQLNTSDTSAPDRPEKMYEDVAVEDFKQVNISGNAPVYCYPA